MKLKADGASRRFAIYDNSGGDAPFDTPLSNLALVRVHSDLEYIADAIPVINATLSLVQTAAGSVPTPRHVQTHIIAAHGLAYLPAVWGRIQLADGWAPLRGSVPAVMVSGNGFASGMARWLTLGADTTNVYIHEYSPIPSQNYWFALSFPVEIHVTDFQL
jgi:hypothetical protein